MYSIFVVQIKTDRTVSSGVGPRCPDGNDTEFLRKDQGGHGRAEAEEECEIGDDQQAPAVDSRFADSAIPMNRVTDSP